MPPVFSHGDLRLYLLHLLDESPRHGYDIMQALSERTGGTYTPSAGTIYPRLAKLEEEGLVTKTTEGRKSIYAITDAGRAEVRTRAGDIDGIEAGLADSVRLIADEVRTSVRAAMKSLRADLAAAAAAEKNAPRQHRADDADHRGASREQLQRAEAAIADFRGQVRAELRTHVARGGELTSTTVDELTAALEAASTAVKTAVASTPEGV